MQNSTENGGLVHIIGNVNNGSAFNASESRSAATRTSGTRGNGGGNGHGNGGSGSGGDDGGDSSGGNGGSGLSVDFADLAEWFRRNNPLYLVSVLLMFFGLYLASADCKVKGPDALWILVSFYVVQNVYEIAVLGMAAYLLRKRINGRHGVILLFFLAVFLCDATMYQSAITSVCYKGNLWVSLMVSFIYFALAVVKVFFLIRALDIRFRGTPVLFSLLAFFLIYMSPQFINQLIVLGTPGIDPARAGTWEIYFIWLAAALIQVPLVVASFKKSEFSGVCPSRFIGCENRFYRALALIPFVALPIQFSLNLHPDLRGFNPNIPDFNYCFALYMYFGTFFIEALYRDLIEDSIGVNNFNFLTGIFIIGFIYITRPTDISIFGGGAVYPHRINVAMIVLALSAVSYYRQNPMCAILIASVAFYYIKSFCVFTVYNAWDYIFIRATGTVRAALAVTLSFLFLGAGFVLSLTGNKKAEKLN